MMKKDKKKLTAAIAAVYAHLSTTGQAAAALPETESASIPAMSAQTMAAPMNIWGMSGRQTQMQARTMLQWRAFK